MTQLISDIRSVTSNISAVSSNSDVSSKLAEALGWTRGLSNIQPLSIESRLHLTRGYIGSQPAVVFAFEKDGVSPVHEAALYAYHASIRWGLLFDQQGATLFNSHWVRRNEWFQLPFISWSELERNIEVFNAITPEKIENNEIEKIATNFYQPDKILRPVDDSLVERLDYWREEALRFSTGVEGVDDNLQTLFAQLFVLRAVEDRGLAPDIASLRTTYNVSKEVDLNGLRSVLSHAKETIGSGLFDSDALEFLPTNLLGGIIHDLYVPHNLPSSQTRYNFSWIDADILGLTYEKYLATVLAPIPKSPSTQLDLFKQPVREVKRISVRKSSGVYYTPPQLVRFLVESCLNTISHRITPEKIPLVADFACGSGSFLVAAAGALISRLREHDPDRNWARELVENRKLIGIEIDPRAVTMARLALWLRFAEEPQPLPLPHLEEVIIQGDSLSEEVWNRVPCEYDVILGNPPFLAVGKTSRRNDLAHRFTSAKGKYDYSYLFIELGVNHLADEGVIGMVMPNRLFRNKDAEPIRELISTETDIKNIVDFGSNEVFDGISAYIGMLVAQKRSTSSPDSLRVINVNDLTPSFLSALLLNASAQSEDIESQTIFAYNSSPHPRGKIPWLLLTPEAKSNRTQLESNSVFLEEISLIKQGIRTGANDVFIVEIESGEDGSLAKIANGISDYGLIERAMLRPVVFGSEIRKYRDVQPNRYLIYPYRNGVCIPESELKERYSHAFTYLSRYKEALSSRASLRNRKWYELAWSRSIDWLQKPKLLIRDLAVATSFSVDISGSTFLVGGTAVIPHSQDLIYPLLAYLNSSFINEYIAQTTSSYRGGFQKFEPQHLQRIPVHKRILDDEDLVQEITEMAIAVVNAMTEQREDELDTLENAIDDRLKSALGFS
ncbi:MAG: N-6 DNA methylase [Cyanobacteria bacterium P01_F01_bin.53]